MAYRVEKEEGGDIAIVMDGVEQGIAASPHEGISDMRNVNVVSVPGEASVAFATSAVSQIPPVLSGVAWTVLEATDTFTYSGTPALYNGMAVTLTVSAGAAGITSGNIYYIGNVTSTTFKVYPSYQLNTAVNVTTDGSGTMSAPQLGTVVWTQNYQPTNYIFAIDSSGRAWIINQNTQTTTGGDIAIGAAQWLGNTTLGSGQGICLYKGYLFVFRSTAIDYISETNFTSNGPNGNWTYGWQVITASTVNKHYALVGRNSVMYFANSTSVGLIEEEPGATFDPTNSATYTFNATALGIPYGDRATHLAFLGENLLIGGVQNVVYSWDTISVGYIPIQIAESRTVRIVPTNTTAFIFAGTRGRIYITNGANADLWVKIPDYISGVPDPYITWTDAMFWRGQLYFGMTATKNDGTTLSTNGGVWSASVVAPSTPLTAPPKTLRCVNRLSYGTYGGSLDALASSTLTSPAGYGFFAFWTNSGSSGIDNSTSNPYVAGEAYIEFDLIPVGTAIRTKTFKQSEFKLSRPLVSGESVEMQWRTNLSDSYTSLGSYSTAGRVSPAQPFQANDQKMQWVQFKTILTSTVTAPSYVSIKEIRVR